MPFLFLLITLLLFPPETHLGIEFVGNSNTPTPSFLTTSLGSVLAHADVESVSPLAPTFRDVGNKGLRGVSGGGASVEEFDGVE
jgi:hypothetical protein